MVDLLCASFANRLVITSPSSFSIVKLSAEKLCKLRTHFAKAVKGYHLVNDSPLKEACWEDVNADILNASGCPVSSQSNGSHKSGGDLTSSLGVFSNKSVQYEDSKNGNKSFKMSSYRLTTVCSDKTPGKIEDIVAEINKRKDFDHYSILARKETTKQITYDWFLIPCDFSALTPDSFVWTPKLGKIGKNKGAITGWETNTINGSSMSISFSMSSQLWIHVKVTDELQSFLIGSVSVDKGRKYTYIQLYDSVNDTSNTTSHGSLVDDSPPVDDSPVVSPVTREPEATLSAATAA